MGRVALKASTLDIRELFPDITRGRHHGRHFHGEIPHDGRSCQAKWSTCSSPLLYYPRFVQCARVAKGIGVNGNERLSQGWNDAKAEARWLFCYLFAFFLLSYACHENQSRKISSITPLDFCDASYQPNRLVAGYPGVGPGRSCSPCTSSTGCELRGFFR
jgi:hypothetical protein